MSFNVIQKNVLQPSLDRVGSDGFSVCPVYRVVVGVVWDWSVFDPDAGGVGGIVGVGVD